MAKIVHCQLLRQRMAKGLPAAVPPHYARAHAAAMASIEALMPIPCGEQTREHEAALALLLAGWIRYADAHDSRYDAGIGADGVLGAPWARIGEAIQELLNGEIGRFDAADLDGLIRDGLQAEGLEGD